MEGSTGELLVDAEDLMLDTKKRLESCSDVYTSFEIVEEDLIFAKKNLKEFEKIYCELMIERSIMKHKQDIYARFTAVTNDYLHYAAVTKHLCEKHLGTCDFEVSSIIFFLYGRAIIKLPSKTVIYSTRFNWIFHFN